MYVSKILYFAVNQWFAQLQCVDVWFRSHRDSVEAGAAAGAASAPATHAVVKSKKAAFTNQHLHIET